MALTLEHHVHRPIARAWWAQADSRIAFLRFTEIGFLRLLTTHAAMDGKPLSVDDAWGLRDRLFDDTRVVFLPEPAGVENQFRRYATGRTASPKLWADAYLLAFAHAAGGSVITFDRALAARAGHCLLLDGEAQPQI